MTAITDIMNLLVFIAGIIGLLRWRQIDKSFYPFVILIWVACLNEALSLILVKLGHYTIINNNVYYLLEAILILFFFENTGLFKGRRMLLLLLIGIYCSFWAIESFAIRRFTYFNIYFLLFYSFSTVLMSISTINRLLVSYKSNLLINATFLICVGFLAFFTLSVLVHSFWLYGLAKSNSFALSIRRIMIFVNLFSNLIFTVALLWIPRKLPSLLPS